MWDDLVRGAIGAVVMVDTTRLVECFPAVDYFEQTGLPFIVAVNTFHGQIHHRLVDVREALAVPDEVPMIYCDARQRPSTKNTLLELVQHALVKASAMEVAD
jgi:signal recognition particle receptor subunit beta